jgi:thioesterase domain-containing protein/acyl carrier protein
MVPGAFVTLDALPQTPNGKIDRKALPDPTGDVLAETSTFVAPRTPTEVQLAAVWSDVLELPRVGTTDNFFHLGGHSLMAIRLFARIRESLGVELPFGLLLQRPTIGALAAVIDQQRGVENAAPPVSALTPLRPTGSRPPIFFTHGIGGEVWSFTALTKHLGEEQPVFGLQPVHDASGQELSIVDLARRYVQEIRTVSPHGPYMLGGHCAGAAVAFEMARQLRAAGQDVGLVAVIDYWLVDTIDRRLRVRVADFLRNLPRWIQDDLVRVSPATVWGRVKSAGRIMSAKIRRAFDRSQTGGDAPRIDIRDRLGMWRFPDYQVAALERAFRMFQEYKPEPYDGDILLVRARTLPLFPVRLAPDMGWGSLVKGTVTIRDVAGSHETIMHEPLVAGVAAVLREEVDRVMTRDTGRAGQ